jgi:alkylation response protein AidB-like acyl-CoA dehydrogenase
MHTGLSPDLLRALREQSGSLDALGEWPSAQLTLLARAGVLGWVIPRELRGSAVSETSLLEGYLDLAAACLTTTFILTQRNGACQRLAASPNARLREELLPSMARGERFATVGISHLTTSRQHARRPAVTIERTPDGLRLNGEIPWVTGAGHAQYIVTGGTLADARQMLVALPTDARGVEIDPPARLLALSGSQTSSVRLDGVLVPERMIVAGPTEQVMKTSTGTTGSLSTSALAVGLTNAALEQLTAESAARPELLEIIAPMETEAKELVRQLTSTPGSVEHPPVASAESIRTRANSLALRSTQALLAASKGAGFVSGHIAERYVREALFFLVWSCPQPVVTAALRELAGLSACS